VGDDVAQVQRMAPGEPVDRPHLLIVGNRPAARPQELLGLRDVERAERDRRGVVVRPHRRVDYPTRQQQHERLPHQGPGHEAGEQHGARIGGVRVVDDDQHR
jgi:hypothetical protein